jgi:opacity protein-like surface antigen
MRTFLAIGVALNVLASLNAARAADMPVKAPPGSPEEVYRWTAFYIGGNVGGGWSADPTVTFAPNDLFSTLLLAGGPISFSTAGPIGGFQAGYNWQLNQAWLLGVESDFDFSSITGNRTLSFFPHP